jgi:hypothetical protein
MAGKGKPAAVSKRGPGQPTKLTPKVAARIADYIRAGNYDYIAAQACGIAQSTFTLWKSRGQAAIDEGKPDEYSEFLAAIKDAEAAREATTVMEIVRDPAWQAKMTYLERRYPERWSKRDRTDVSGTLTIRYEDAE